MFKILTEVEIFSGVQHGTKSFLQVLVRYLAVSVKIKQVEDFLELLIRLVMKSETPVLAKILELPRLNFTRFAQI